MRDYDVKETAQRSDYRAVKDFAKCKNCGECVRRCRVFAHKWEVDEDGRSSVYNRDDCTGCGACVQVCRSDALHLEPVSEEEWCHVASSFTEWEEQRLAYLAAQNE
jgi:NAD-dependent dihydropyrimidine dehydrogenase PreA subunit